MGDRCYMCVTCFDEDAHEFQKLGFLVDDYADASPAGVVNLYQEEANYAHYDDMLRLAEEVGLTFLSSHTEGGEYDAHEAAAFNGEHAEVSTTIELGIVIGCTEHGAVENDYARAMDYFRVRDAARRALGLPKEE